MLKQEERLRRLREEHGVLQEELADQLNVSRQTISKWETGKSSPSLENLRLLSQLWSIPIEGILDDDWKPPEEKPPEVHVVEVPVSRPINYRLCALLAALILAVGIMIGALFFQKRNAEEVPRSDLESEVISSSEILEYMPMLPLSPESELDVSEADSSMPVIYTELLPPASDSSNPN